MLTDKPSLTKIITVVRLAGDAGRTAAYVASVMDAKLAPVKKALDLQVQAGFMSTEELFHGERYVSTIYKMREGLPG